MPHAITPHQAYSVRIDTAHWYLLFLHIHGCPSQRHMRLHGDDRLVLVRRECAVEASHRPLSRVLQFVAWRCVALHVRRDVVNR
jgi:hypothetical protein